jgi:hypothetical protein
MLGMAIWGILDLFFVPGIDLLGHKPETFTEHVNNS